MFLYLRRVISRSEVKETKRNVVCGFADTYLENIHCGDGAEYEGLDIFLKSRVRLLQ